MTLNPLLLFHHFGVAVIKAQVHNGGNHRTESMSMAEQPHLDDDTLAFAERVFDMARQGDTEQLQPLLEQGLPANLRNSKGDSLLMLAAYNGHRDTAALILQHGGDPELANQRCQTPLAGVIFKGDKAMIELLIEHGADVNGCPEGGKPPLMYAAMFDRPDILQRLLEAGANPQASDAEGNTALKLAMAMGASEAAALLQAQ